MKGETIMNTRLKKLQLIFTILLLLSLCGCRTDTTTQTNPKSSFTSPESVTTAEKTMNPSGTMKPERRKQVRLEINNNQNKIHIPDPAKIKEDIVSISLWDSEADNVSESQWKLFHSADLSFAGLGQNMLVSAYTTGNLTTSQSHTKNCLALFVHENPETEQEKNYFLVLDYGHGTYYLTETAFFLHSRTRPVDLQARDLSGDGIQELIVSHIYNKSIEVGVFRTNEQSHTLTPLFSTLELDDFAKTKSEFDDRSWFQGHLEDNYNVVLEFPQIQYSQTVSMIDDGGYSQNNLEVGSRSRYGDESIFNFVALWKDGKLQEKEINSPTVFLYTLAHVDYPIGKSGKPQLELVRAICIGRRSESIGNMHIFLQYDPDEELLTLKEVKYVNYNQAAKERETFTEWKVFK